MELADMEAELEEWWNRESIEERFRRKDPASAIGYLPVADLDRDSCDAAGRDDVEIANLLGGTSIQSFLAL